MKSSLIRVVVATLLIAFTTGAVSRAQSSGDDSKRKVKTRVNPKYPEIARSMSLGGKVRIEVVIAPDGHVKAANALGGHPLLVQSCLEVIRDWKYEAGPSETTQIVEFEFTAPH
jgi:TonB family protein